MNVARLKALLVEDELISRLTEKFLLEEHGFEVDVAETAIDALEKINELSLSSIDKTYDVIFMDIGLPDIDGHRISEVIRKTEIRAPIPIVAVTSHDSPEDIEKYLKMGISYVIIKPMRMEDIKKLLKLLF